MSKQKYQSPIVESHDLNAANLFAIASDDSLDWEWAIVMAETEFTVTATVDDIPVRGNAMASGDDAFDRTVEDDILRRLDDGDVWAWAAVSVSVPCPCCDQPIAEYLGGCSYANETEFRAGGYYVDMCEELVTRVIACASRDVLSGTADDM